MFLLVGPSGVGKTETAPALADLMFGGERALITINLSEYQEAHTVSQLKGSPPGYVGYGEGGVLTEAVRQRPTAWCCSDEVEKAHRDVLNLFYQVFDRGFMRDGEGRVIDFRNTVIVMTSNLAATRSCSRHGRVSRSRRAATPGMLDGGCGRPDAGRAFPAGAAGAVPDRGVPAAGRQAHGGNRPHETGQGRRAGGARFGVPLACDDGLVDALVAACLLPDTGARNIDSLLDQQILPVLAASCSQRGEQGGGGGPRPRSGWLSRMRTASGWSLTRMPLAEAGQ